MQDLPAGTERTVREFAEKMIAISDNTATDHVMDYVGRPAVERGLKLAGHGQPALNIPFLGTRELFALKLAATPDEVAAYKDAPVARKRKLLDELRGRPIDVAKAVAEWTQPRLLELEWFASGRDTCAVWAALAARAKLDPASELMQIVSKNRGTEADPTVWPFVGFKGGSEPGVLHLSALARRSDGKWFVVVVAVNDDQKPIDQALVLNAATGVMKLLGAEAAASP
jgi:beta-lactamase class A